MYLTGQLKARRRLDSKFGLLCEPGSATIFDALLKWLLKPSSTFLKKYDKTEMKIHSKRIHLVVILIS